MFEGLFLSKEGKFVPVGPAFEGAEGITVAAFVAQRIEMDDLFQTGNPDIGPVGTHFHAPGADGTALETPLFRCFQDRFISGIISRPDESAPPGEDFLYGYQ